MPKLTQKEKAKRHGIGSSTVSDILKRKQEYIQEFDKNANVNKHRFNNAGKYDDISELTWRWFSSARVKNIPISGPIIQEKAAKFAIDLGHLEFKASNGWLNSWESVRSFKVSGESTGVDQTVVSDFKERIPEIVRNYKPENVFNCDETGLY